ncbi:HdeD family acid-resistance protein [Mycolicibacterium hodleri]
MRNGNGVNWAVHVGCRATLPFVTTPSVPSLLPHLWKSAVVSGLLAIAIGVAIVAWPGISITVAAIFFGAGLLLTGIQQVFFAFSLHVSAGGRVLLFISGAASLILAIMAFRHLYDAVLLLAIWIGVGFIFRGVATAVSAISDPTLPGRGWNVFVGVISLVAGVVVLASPFDSIGTLALVVGVWLIVIGVMEVAAAVAIRRATNQHSGQGQPAH